MTEKNGLTRKEFLTSLGKGVLGATLCGAAGAQAQATPAAKPDTPPLPFSLEAVGKLDPLMEKLNAVAYGPQEGPTKDLLYVAGSAGIKVFDTHWTLLRTLKTSDTAVCVAADAEGNVFAGQRTKIEKFDINGNLMKTWGELGDGPGQFRYITGIAANDRFVYVTDSGARRIHRYAADGDYIDDITGPPDGSEKGFQIPSAYFDCKLDDKGILFVGHTGMHRIERYDTNNNLSGHWGQFGNDRASFCGCCNPTNLALFGDGRIATTEKGVPRLKVYDAEGKLLACLDEGAFPGNTAGMSLAISSQGRIALAEPIFKTVRFYELKKV